MKRMHLIIVAVVVALALAGLYWLLERTVLS